MYPTNNNQTNIQQPNMMMPQPNMMMPQPNMMMPQPNMMMPQPNMMMPQPNMMMPQPNMMMPQPNMMMPQPNMMMPQPNMMMPQPNMMMPQGFIPANQYMNQNMMYPMMFYSQQQMMPCNGMIQRQQSSIEDVASLSNLNKANNTLESIIQIEEIADETDGKQNQNNVVNQNNVAVNNLANTLNNILDGTRVPEVKDKEFEAWTNNKNVVKSIYPKDKQHAHFNKTTHPNEIYKVEFVNDSDNKIYDMSANDLNEYALTTHKHIYEHNNTLKGSKSATGFIYARCSTTNDISIETQRKLCFDYATNENIKLFPFGYQFDNNVSARNMNNLNYEFGYWQKYIQDGSDIIIYSIDRMSRNLLKGIQFLEDIAKRNITVHFVTNEIKYNSNISAAQKSMVQNELQTAEKFSNITSEKIKASVKRLKDQGHVIGKAPYGFQNSLVNGIKKRIPNNSESENIRKIKEKYIDLFDNFDNYIENEGVRRSQISIIKFIIRWCCRNGINYRDGKSFTNSQIKNIINS
jgi:DNA invertase Pin-like site-specific DNA recombinase